MHGVVCNKAVQLMIACKFGTCWYSMFYCIYAMKKCLAPRMLSGNEAVKVKTQKLESTGWLIGYCALLRSLCLISHIAIGLLTHAVHCDNWA